MCSFCGTETFRVEISNRQIEKIRLELGRQVTSEHIIVKSRNKKNRYPMISFLIIDVSIYVYVCISCMLTYIVM